MDATSEMFLSIAEPQTQKPELSKICKILHNEKVVAFLQNTRHISLAVVKSKCVDLYAIYV